MSTSQGQSASESLFPQRNNDDETTRLRDRPSAFHSHSLGAADHGQYSTFHRSETWSRHLMEVQAPCHRVGPLRRAGARARRRRLDAYLLARYREVHPLLEHTFRSKVTVKRYHRTYLPHPGYVAEGVTFYRHGDMQIPLWRRSIA